MDVEAISWEAYETFCRREPLKGESSIFMRNCRGFLVSMVFANTFVPSIYKHFYKN